MGDPDNLNLETPLMSANRNISYEFRAWTRTENADIALRRNAGRYLQAL